MGNGRLAQRSAVGKPLISRYAGNRLQDPGQGFPELLA
jgi:hypothetical protein